MKEDLRSTFGFIQRCRGNIRNRIDMRNSGLRWEGKGEERLSSEGQRGRESERMKEIDSHMPTNRQQIVNKSPFVSHWVQTRPHASVVSSRLCRAFDYRLRGLSECLTLSIQIHNANILNKLKLAGGTPQAPGE